MECKTIALRPHVRHKIKWEGEVHHDLKLINFYESHRCTVHFVKSLQLLTNKCTYITYT